MFNSPIRPRRVVAKAATFVAASALWLLSGQASATVFNMGPADPAAIDQPRVTWGLTNETTSTLIGPLNPGSGVLDTGANGVLLGQLSHLGGESYGQPAFAFDYDGSGVIDGDELLAQYKEQGVAGFSLLDVYDVHGLRVTDSDGVQRLVNPAVRAFGDSGLSLGSFNAVVGMPAMNGFVVEVDMRPLLTQPFPDFIRTAFHNNISQATFESASSTNVNLRIIPPEYTDTTFIDAGRTDLLPTFAGLPVIDGVDLTHTGGSNSGGATLSTTNKTFLLDSGAQSFLISRQMAIDMGIDFDDTPGTGTGTGADVVDILTAGGIGGEVDIPIVEVDRFEMQTADGHTLVWTDLNAGVLDIDGAPFDAVFGMNMLTTGYLDAVFGAGGDPLLDKVIWDFTPTDGTATMRLDFNNLIVPEPGTIVLFATGCVLLAGRNRRR